QCSMLNVQCSMFNAQCSMLNNQCSMFNVNVQYYMIDKNTKTKRFETAKVSYVAFSHAAHDIYTAFLPPMLPLLIDKLHISYSHAGLLVMLVRLPSILSILVGALGKYISMRWVVIFMPAVTAIAMSFITLAPTYEILCTLLMAAGISSAFYHVPAPVMISHVSGDQIGKGMSYFMFAGEFARMLGPIIILTAISIWGFNGAYKVVFIGFATTILLFLKIRNISLKENFKEQQSALANLKITLIRQKRIFIIAGGLLLSKTFMIIALSSFLPTFMTVNGSGLWLAGAALSIIELAGAAGTFMSGTMSDKLGGKRMLMFLTVAAPIVMIVFVFLKGWVVFPVLIILGLLAFSFSPIIMAMVLKNEKEYGASASGIYMTMNFAFGALVALIFGFLGDILDLRNTFILSAVLAFIGIPFVMMIEDDK
ncbi:MAG: transporter, family, fosmidomycin resistance protein, partial [Bacteroidota bacterium]|nr:transporter, family, fosmidomycin resistance protein [Bacteroidota bacterium]